MTKATKNLIEQTEKNLSKLGEKAIKESLQINIDKDRDGELVLFVKELNN